MKREEGGGGSIYTLDLQAPSEELLPLNAHRDKITWTIKQLKGLNVKET